MDLSFLSYLGMSMKSRPGEDGILGAMSMSKDCWVVLSTLSRTIQSAGRGVAVEILVTRNNWHQEINSNTEI